MGARLEQFADDLRVALPTGPDQRRGAELRTEDGGKPVRNCQPRDKLGGGDMTGQQAPPAVICQINEAPTNTNT